MGMEMQNAFRDFMGEVGRVIGLDSLVPSEEGLVSLGVDRHSFQIQCIPQTGRLLVFLAVTSLSKGMSSSVYRELLGANLFAHGTGGGWFGLEGESEEVVYHCLVDFDPLPPDPEEFVTLLERIIELAEYWEHHLQEVAEAGEPVSEIMPPDHGHWGIQP